ncbi:genetic competence negative regulator [Mesobacillus zeae]|uniref:Genetic competence negative regulator n=1 Tax=Mesobacillus zeae TaxID=1917180 RepID=A0A398BAX3_9BACI|nr:genetic competence negative regulator [Mesobacillus zeae]RID87319.1 genetic competence negative regulator [Mesobacillus zeae]
MRLERLTFNKIKIFLTSDDLSDRGLTKEDIWKDSLKWQQLFQDMLEEASDEFGLDFVGSVAVEIFSLQAQGMVMIVTMGEQNTEEDELDEGIIEMQVKMEGCEVILFEFAHFEDVLSLASRLFQAGVTGGTLYSFENTYYVEMDSELPEQGKIVALMAEYGDPSIFSIHRLAEYGKVIIEGSAVETLVQYFQ